MRRKYHVYQGCIILGERYEMNETVFLTDVEALPYVGMSIELASEELAAMVTPIGEHREIGIDVQEDTRPLKEIRGWEEDVRPNLRPERSEPVR